MEALDGHGWNFLHFPAMTHQDFLEISWKILFFLFSQNSYCCFPLDKERIYDEKTTSYDSWEKTENTALLSGFWEFQRR